MIVCTGCYKKFEPEEFKRHDHWREAMLFGRVADATEITFARWQRDVPEERWRQATRVLVVERVERDRRARVLEAVAAFANDEHVRGALRHLAAHVRAAAERRPAFVAGASA